MEAVFLFGLFILLLMLSVPIGYAIGMVMCTPKTGRI